MGIELGNCVCCYFKFARPNSLIVAASALREKATAIIPDFLQIVRRSGYVTVAMGAMAQTARQAIHLVCGVMGFSPPAPVQGPFLYLLLNNEDEGLRLVHALTNAASEKWREYEQRKELDRPALTPLPVTINLPSGSREFWGDTQVYCWFRGTTVSPYPVISALMALEEWMERQIEAGRDVEALFEGELIISCFLILPTMVTEFPICKPDILTRLYLI